MSEPAMKLDLSKITALFAVVLPLWGGIVFLWNYEKALAYKVDLPDMELVVTKNEKALSDLDSKIANTVILTTLYELHGLTELNELERVKYDRANTRLVALRGQRDGLLGISND